jgi:serine/threonine protein phosphatase 1
MSEQAVTYPSDPTRFLSPEEIELIENCAKVIRPEGVEPTHNIVMSDIHGCFRLLRDMLVYIAESKPEPSALLFLGDYIDRGKHSAKVIATVRLLQDIMGNHCIPHLGNHEDMWIACWRDGYEHHYVETTRSFPFWSVPDDVKEWTMKLNLYSYDENYFYVHAGINPDRDMLDQDPADLLWIRSEFLNSKKKFPRMVIHGHTPRELIDIRENRVNIDSAAVFGYHLTALLIDPNNPKPKAYWMLNERKKSFHVI